MNFRNCTSWKIDPTFTYILSDKTKNVNGKKFKFCKSVKNKQQKFEDINQ